MRTAIGHLLAAIALAAVGFGLWTVGHAEQRLVETHRRLQTLQFQAIQSDATALDADLHTAERMPVLGQALRGDVGREEAIASYWLARYQELEPKRDAAGSIVEDNPQRLLLAANAAFRSAQAEKADRATLVHRYEALMTSYADVLRLDGSMVDAAYNYEYVVRLRDAAAKPGRPPAKEAKPPRTPTIHGLPGGPPEGVNMGDFKIVVPKSMEEREEQEVEPGGEVTRPRRG
jgi:hypothetical protein